jgi:phosphotransferase system IIB component
MDSPFNEFLKSNSWWLALIFVGLIVLSIALIYLSGIHSNKAKVPEKVIDKNAYLLALGGSENVISKKVTGSRIVLVLKDYSKVDQTKLKEAGVDSFIMMSDKLTLVIKDNAEKVFQTIFG